MKIIFILIFILFEIGFTKKNVIAKIPEASGICYSKSRNSLFVVNDEGKIYEINKQGKILKKKNLGDYDLEGVACDNESLFVVVEGDDSLLKVSQKSLKIKKKISIKRKFNGIRILQKDKEHGLEAITIENGNILISNQSYNRYPKKDSSVVFQINNTKKKKAKIIKVFDHGYFDIAALTYHNNQLYMISDKKNLLIVYDIVKNKTLKKIKLPKFAQEGICFDNEEMLYIADDNGRILKFNAKKLGI